MLNPEDEATFICYGLCLLGIVLTLGGLMWESRAIKKQAEKMPESHESEKS